MVLFLFLDSNVEKQAKIKELLQCSEQLVFLPSKSKVATVQFAEARSAYTNVVVKGFFRHCKIANPQYSWIKLSGVSLRCLFP